MDHRWANSWAHLEHFGSFADPSGISHALILDPTWNQLGLFWIYLGPLMRRFGPYWNLPGSLVDHRWVGLGPILETILDPEGAYLGLDPNRFMMGPKWIHPGTALVFCF